MANERLLLIGASVRAAAFSALRAGFSPWCFDLFADIDLAAVCPAQLLTTHYPDGFEAALAEAPPGPWLYTGGLENHPQLVDRISRQRHLWGNPAVSLRACRDPSFVCRVLRSAGLPCPEIKTTNKISNSTKRWLIKPLRGTGGMGVHFRNKSETIGPGKYAQEFIEGDSYSAIFVGAGSSTRLLGLTRQLVGEGWLHARPFQYCGSIGPLPLSAPTAGILEHLGRTLARQCNLIGLFGIDGIMRNEIFYVVEINPRYTASVEVIEYATGVQALDWHRLACTQRQLPPHKETSKIPIVGKAILFAGNDVAIPTNGPWRHDLDRPFDPWRLPQFADIPKAGSLIRKRQPILTALAKGPTHQVVVSELQRAIKEVETILFPFIDQ